MDIPLIVSEEAMETARTGYLDCASRMTTLRDTLKTAVEDIRSGWKSDAGTAFFEKFDDEWLKNFNDYIAVIEHMGDNMSDAQKKYRPLFEDADKINLI